MKARPFQRPRSALARERASSTRTGYDAWSGAIASLFDESRRHAARSINAILTATYWEIGRRIVEFVQVGEARAGYGHEVLKRLSQDLTKKFGRGFSVDNLQFMRAFHLANPMQKIYETLSRKSQLWQSVQPVSGKSLIPISATRSRKCETPSRISDIDLALYLDALAQAFPLSWSHYVRLLSVENPEARKFYETESLQGGWSVRQLDRQISTLFYERTALSKNKARMLAAGVKPRLEDAVSVEEEIKSPYVLEFLNLRDDYAEGDLEEALVRHLEAFLLELGSHFTFVARQKKIRVGKEWYRIDLLLFHRRMRCLFIIDLKLGRFTEGYAAKPDIIIDDMPGTALNPFVFDVNAEESWPALADNILRKHID